MASRGPEHTIHESAHTIVHINTPLPWKALPCGAAGTQAMGLWGHGAVTNGAAGNEAVANGAEWWKQKHRRVGGFSARQMQLDAPS